jgi:hypothetical protein
MNRNESTYAPPAPLRLTRGRLIAQALLMTLPLVAMLGLTAAAPFSERARAGARAETAACGVGQPAGTGSHASSP